jgi:hypothetical protein
LKANLFLLILFLLISYEYHAQTKTNLEKILEAIDTEILKADDVLNESKSIPVLITTSSLLEILKPKIGEAFLKRGYKLVAQIKTDEPKILFSLLSVKINYLDAQKDGFFGDVLVDRAVSIKGTIEKTSKEGNLSSINIDNTAKDIILIDDIKLIEDGTLPFTQAPAPQIPFLSNLIEPVIVVGTLVVTVLLLFLVRGK